MVLLAIEDEGDDAERRREAGADLSRLTALPFDEVRSPRRLDFSKAGEIVCGQQNWCLKTVSRASSSKAIASHLFLVPKDCDAGARGDRRAPGRARAAHDRLRDGDTDAAAHATHPGDCGEPQVQLER